MSVFFSFSSSKLNSFLSSIGISLNFNHLLFPADITPVTNATAIIIANDINNWTNSLPKNIKFASVNNTNGIIDKNDKNSILFLKGLRQINGTIKDVSALIK